MQRLTFAFALSAAILVMGASAIAKPTVVLKLAGDVVQKNEKGERQLVPLSGITLHSGEIVRYDVTARNTGTNPAKNLVPVGTIPIGTVYEAGSASSTNALRVEFSIDGGKTWSVSPMVKVRNAAGVLVEKKASPARFTAVRWISEKPLDPKSTVTYDYEVRVK